MECNNEREAFPHARRGSLLLHMLYVCGITASLCRLIEVHLQCRHHLKLHRLLLSAAAAATYGANRGRGERENVQLIGPGLLSAQSISTALH